MKNIGLVFMVALLVLVYGCEQAAKEVQDIEESPVEVKEVSGSEVKIVVDAQTEATMKIISIEELSEHDNEADCWIVYEGYVFDFSEADMHPNMAKTFYQYCGEIDGFEEGAKTRHSGSNVERVENFGKFLGELS